MRVSKSKRWSSLLATLLLLVAFLIASWHLQRESLWDDEGWSLWAVQADSPVETLSRVQSDVHPPLYFVLLDSWVALAGESVYAVRFLSLLAGMVGLAASYALGKRLFDSAAGLTALALLATSGFFIYYARETRMYTLLLALATLATCAYLAWREAQTPRRALIYTLLLTALLYTHYSGGLIVLTHAVHLLITRRVRVRAAVVPFLLSGALYLPWALILLEQARLHGRPLALALPTNADSIYSLLLVVTSGAPLLFTLPSLVALWMFRRARDAGLLLLLWLLITPICLFALNAWLTPMYQVRYTIASLPAAALLAAAGTTQILSTQRRKGTKQPGKKTLRAKAQIGSYSSLITHYSSLFCQSSVLVFTLILLFTQLTAYPTFWPAKSRYGEAAAQMAAARQPYEPLIADIYWPSATAYYDRVYGIRRGAFVDVTWQPRSITHDRMFAAGLDASLPVWVVMPTNVARTWDVIAALAETRTVGYRDSVMNILFYRFDPRGGDALHFGFGGQLAYTGSIDSLYSVEPGSPLCPEIPLTALAPLDERYGASVQLLNADETPIAAWDGAVGAHATGEAFRLSACIAIPHDLPAGDLHLQLAIYDLHSLARLPLLEDAGLYWGDRLVLGAILRDRNSF
jgi:uncharacterized membrane protein